MTNDQARMFLEQLADERYGEISRFSALIVSRELPHLVKLIASVTTKSGEAAQSLNVAQLP